MSKPEENLNKNLNKLTCARGQDLGCSQENSLAASFMHLVLRRGHKEAVVEVGVGSRTGDLLRATWVHRSSLGVTTHHDLSPGNASHQVSSYSTSLWPQPQHRGNSSGAQGPRQGRGGSRSQAGEGEGEPRGEEKRRRGPGPPGTAVSVPTTPTTVEPSFPE